MKTRINRHVDVDVKVDRGCKVPSRKRSTDAGYDISSAVDIKIPKGKRALVPTGVRVCCPEGYAYFITGRSSLIARGIDHPLGVIDAGYTGELHITLHNNSNRDFEVKAGDRIAQLVFFPIIHANLRKVTKFSEKTARGDLGWGSSGV